MPVTVLKWISAVTSVRTKEKDGYVAVQLGVGKAKVEMCRRLCAVICKSKIEPKKKWPNSRERRCTSAKSGAELSVAHFLRAVRRRLRRRAHQAKSFASIMKRYNFRGCAPRAACRLRTAAPVRPVNVRIRQGVQGQEDGGPYGRPPRDAEPDCRGRCRTGS